MIKKEIKVAIALIVHRGKVVVGWRDEHLHQGGCYEFPGGKVEQKESPEQAVRREVQEEVGVQLNQTQLFEEIHHGYADRNVHLYFYLCSLEPSSRIDITRSWQWHDMADLASLSFPAANKSIIERLNWSKYLCITASDFCKDHVNTPVSDLVYLRKKYTQISQCIEEIQILKQTARLILNVEYYQQLPLNLQKEIFAVHFRQDQIHMIKPYQNTKNMMIACHSSSELKVAQRLGAHAVFYSPVLSTPTHPDTSGMGWDIFQHNVLEYNFPIYALGGMNRSDLELAEKNGAYGVAGIRDFWLS